MSVSGSPTTAAESQSRPPEVEEYHELRDQQWIEKLPQKVRQEDEVLAELLAGARSKEEVGGLGTT